MQKSCFIIGLLYVSTCFEHYVFIIRMHGQQNIKKNIFYVQQLPPPLPNPPENRAVYEIREKNIIGQSRTQMTIWRMRITCWIPKATDTHSEYVILTAFPMRHQLQERAQMLRYTTLPVSF